MKTPVTRLLFLALPALLTLLGAGCAQTKIESTSAAPGTGPMKFTKVFVLAIARDDTDRRLAEIAVKSQITRIPAVGSYEPLPDISDTREKAKVIQAIKASQADGIIVLRLTSRDTKVTTGASNAHAMEYQIFSDYYGAVYDVGAFYSSDTRVVSADSIFYIETRIFDAKTEKLIWSGETKSTKNAVNDHDVRGVITEVAEVIKGALQSEGLVR